MTFTKKGKWLLAIILVVGTVGALLNLVFGQGASNRSFLIPIGVALVFYVRLKVWKK